MKALILHARRTGLGILRSLSSQGVECYVADTFKAEAFFSKFSQEGFIIPNLIDSGSESLLEALKKIARKIDPEGEGIYLFTGSDDYLMFFVNNWPELSIYFKASFETDKTILEACLSKTKMYEIAHKAGLKIPRSYYSPVNAKNIDHFPVIIKPSLKKTDSVDVVKEGFRIRKAEDITELQEAINILESLSVSYVVQQYIPGGDESLYTSGVFSYKGDLHAIANGRKLRQFPPELGECSLGELVDESKLKQLAINLLKQAGVTGIAQIEYKKFQDDFYLMEINPRPWSWISLTDYAGVNLPIIAIEAIESNGKSQSRIIEQDIVSGYWMFPTADFLFNVIKSKNQSLFAFLKDLKAAQCFAFWDKTDLKPFLAHLYLIITRDLFKR